MGSPYVEAIYRRDSAGADVGGHRVGQAIRSPGRHRDVQPALARAAQHPVPLQRRVVDDRRQRLALAQRRDAADDVAGGALGGGGSAIAALGTPSAAAAAFSDSLDGTGSTATASPFGTARTRVLNTCSALTPCAGQFVDRLVAERLLRGSWW